MADAATMTMRTNLLSNLVVDGAVQCATVKRRRCAVWLVRAMQTMPHQQRAIFLFFLLRRKVDVTASTRRDTRYQASCSLAALSGASNLNTPSRTRAAEDKQEQRFMAFAGRLFGPHSPIGILMQQDRREPCAPVPLLPLVPDRCSPFHVRALASPILGAHTDAESLGSSHSLFEISSYRLMKHKASSQVSRE